MKNALCCTVMLLLWHQDDVVERLAWEARAFINDQTEKAQAAPAIRWPPPPGDLVIISMGAGTVFILQYCIQSRVLRFFEPIVIWWFVENLLHAMQL